MSTVFHAAPPAVHLSLRGNVADARRGGTPMPRSVHTFPTRHRRHASSARFVRRSAITSIVLGCLLAATTGVVLARGAGAAGRQPAPPPADNQAVACTITLPPDALTAKGLATPWVLSGDNGGDCAETNPDQAAFIDATIFDPATNQVTIYRPLVITRGTTPAAEPAPPKLPAGAVVEVSVGFNGDQLTLADANGGQDITASKCVNGLPGAVFGQEIFCNAPAFYAAANGHVTFSPPRGTSPDDQRPCPTTESWEIVDQDQSDNTTTKYLVRGDQTAQSTTANQGTVGNDQIGNGSDNALYTGFYAPAIGCQPPSATDVTDPAAPVRSTSSGLLNLFARAANDAKPALVPMGDPFTLVDGTPSLEKTNLYRAQVNQPAAASAQDASVADYCRNLLDLGLSKIELDTRFLQKLGKSPDPAVSNDLHLFVLNRFKESWDNLGCQDATGIANPVTVKTDANGRVRSARVGGSTKTTKAPTTTAAPATTEAPATTDAPATTQGPATTAAPTTSRPPATTAAGAGTAGPTSSTTAPPVDAPATTAVAAMNAVAPSGGSPSTPIAGLAERNRPVGTTVANATLARSGIGTGLLPFTGLNARALLLVSAALLGIGGWLLVWAGRARRVHQAR
jgi:hypothetical protein